MSTAYFYDQWVELFSSSYTKRDTFKNADGKEVECEFMNRTEGRGIYQTKRFQSTWLEFEGGSNMFLFLPKRGVSLEEVLIREESGLSVKQYRVTILLIEGNEVKGYDTSNGSDSA